MAVSTTENAIRYMGGINEASNKILSKLNGQKSAEEMIGEYFGLRKEVLFSDDGQDVTGMIDEFRDHDILQKKKVRYVEYFATKGLTKEMYDKVIPTSYTYKEPLKDNKETNGQDTSASASTKKSKRKS